MNWFSLQHLLENAIPSVLIILDCCYAANSARDTTTGSTTKELLAACGREYQTPGPSNDSYTYALVRELWSFGTTPFTISSLHTRLMTSRGTLRFTPIYVNLSEHGSSSITISPLAEISSLVPGPGLVIESHCQTIATDVTDAAADITGKTLPNIASGTHDVETRVLLAISVAQNTTPDIRMWKSWLDSATAPPEIEGITAKAVDAKMLSLFNSFSKVVLVSIPVRAWNLLPERSAYRFVGFVNSGDVLHRVSNGPMSALDLESLVKSAVESAVDSAVDGAPGIEALIEYNHRQSHISPLHAAMKGNKDMHLVQYLLASCETITRRSKTRQCEDLRKVRQLPFVSIGKSMWDRAKIERFLDIYDHERRILWKRIAGETEEEWQTVETMVCIAEVENCNNNSLHSLQFMGMVAANLLETMLSTKR